MTVRRSPKKSTATSTSTSRLCRQPTFRNLPGNSEPAKWRAHSIMELLKRGKNSLRILLKSPVPATAMTVTGMTATAMMVTAMMTTMNTKMDRTATTKNIIKKWQLLLKTKTSNLHAINSSKPQK